MPPRPASPTTISIPLESLSFFFTIKGLWCLRFFHAHVHSSSRFPNPGFLQLLQFHGLSSS
jgi:hypothetical protein